MTQLIDLTRPLGNVDKTQFPPEILPLLRILAPRIQYTDHKTGADVMKLLFNCAPEDLPSGEGWAEEDLYMSSHLGTHVDAPWHYGSQCEGKPARTIDQIALDELYCPAVVLDMTVKRATGAAITIDDLKAQLEKRSVLPNSTWGRDADSHRPRQICAERSGALQLSRHDARVDSLVGGARARKIGGTDATGWDRPFHVMIENFQRTKDKSFIWDAHFACRDRELIVVQQLANLDTVPAHGFRVGFFPLKLEKCSSAPARVVAFL